MIESKEEWVAYFCSLPFDKIVWKVEWLQTSSAILHCPGHHFVPLLGLRGMAVYTPFRVLRQFGMVQVIPVVEDLSDWFFDFDTAEDETRSKTGLKLWCGRTRSDIPREIDTDGAERYLAKPEYNMWVEENFLLKEQLSSLTEAVREVREEAEELSSAEGYSLYEDEKRRRKRGFFAKVCKRFRDV